MTELEKVSDKGLVTRLTNAAFQNGCNEYRPRTDTGLEEDYQAQREAETELLRRLSELDTLRQQLAAVEAFLDAFDTWCESEQYGGDLFDKMLNARAELTVALRENARKG